MPAKLVNDYTGTLTPDQINSLENKLVAFNDSTTTQIAVVIVATVGDYDINDYSVKLGRAWGIGGKENNNGVLLLIAKNDRRLNIATGYGVEGALPDITAKHIIEDVIKPNFKGEDYYRGIHLGTDAIMSAVKGEYTAPPRANGKKKSSNFPFILIALILFLLFTGGGGRGRGGQFMSRRGSRGLAGPLIWGSMLGGGGGGGGWSGGGSSGGGFGGFGGGSFGGGGASGSW